ncbi:MAG: hypothetical protein ACK526_01795 [Planctomyces sp.]
METDQVFLSVGAVVAFFGMALVLWHVAQHRRQLDDAGDDPNDLKFADDQYRRRMQTSSLTIILGALIALCESLPRFQNSPRFAVGYIIFLLIVAFVLVVLALKDAVASRIHLNRSIREHRVARRVLHDAVEELRRRQRNPSEEQHQESDDSR